MTRYRCAVQFAKGLRSAIKSSFKQPLSRAFILPEELSYHAIGGAAAAVGTPEARCSPASAGCGHGVGGWRSNSLWTGSSGGSSSSGSSGGGSGGSGGALSAFLLPLRRDPASVPTRTTPAMRFLGGCRNLGSSSSGNGGSGELNSGGMITLPIERPLCILRGAGCGVAAAAAAHVRRSRTVRLVPTAPLSPVSLRAPPRSWWACGGASGPASAPS